MKLYVDGGSRGNPGPSAAAYVLKSGEKYVDYNGIFLGLDKTNNQAEYSAVYLGLLAALERRTKIKTLEIFSDSKLVVEQLNGKWQVNDEDIKNRIEDIKDLLAFFNGVSIIHIPREENQAADFIVNLTLDANPKEFVKID